MSGVNSSAAATSAAAATAVDAAVAMELQALAADAKALQGMLMTGDIVQATVQPFNGLTDTLQIFGLRVAASLPPNVYPGDTLTVSVQGFQNDQVQVQVLSRTPSPNVPPATPQPSSPPVPQEADSVELTRMPIPIIVDEEPEFPPLLPPPSAPPATSTAQSDDVESAASPPASVNAAAAAAAAADEEAAAQNTVVQTPGATAQQTAAYAQARPETLSVEARLAFARTTPIPPRASPTPPSGTVPPPRPAPATTASQPASTAARATAPGLPSSTRTNVNAPPIAPRAPFAPIITPRPDIAARTPQPIPGAPVQARSTTMMPASQTRPQAAPTPEELLQDPVALLRSLRIPQTPTTLTFAKLVTQQPEQVSTALAALEDALPDSDDPRIQTLRTLAGFVGNLDPESPTFTTQVTSYLTHVIEGPEQKLAMLVAQEPQPQPTTAAAAPATEEEAAPTPQTSAPASQDATVVAAQSAERIAAVNGDLKTQLISLLASAQPESVLGETGAVLARNALTGIVASQLSAINAQQAQPGTWSFTVPIMLGQQMYPARIAVSRDKPDSRQAINGDDFHIAFILDTKRLGTIAIDMHAVQRSVSVSVRTERPSAATTFKSALAQLGKRLEEMRYNVKALEAGTTRVKTPESQEPVPSDSLGTTDKKA